MYSIAHQLGVLTQHLPNYDYNIAYADCLNFRQQAHRLLTGDTASALALVKRGRTTTRSNAKF